MIKLHPFLAKNSSIWKLADCGWIQGLEKFMDENADPLDKQIIPGGSVSVNILCVDAMMDILKLPHLDSTVRVYSTGYETNEFSVPGWCDMFLGVSDPSLVEMIQIGTEAYPFPGIPQVYTTWMTGKKVTIFTNAPCPEGIDIQCRMYPKAFRDSIYERLKSWYDPINMIMYNLGSATPGFMDKHNRFTSLDMGPVERYKNRNQETNIAKEYTDIIYKGKTYTLPQIKIDT
jgi:hypothetical protein